MNPAFTLLVVNLKTVNTNHPPSPPCPLGKRRIISSRIDDKKGSKPEIKTVNGRKIYHILSVTNSLQETLQP